jgi:hypothetical protein
MTTTKHNFPIDLAPKKYLKKWGAAKIDVLLNKEQIEKWLKIGFTTKSIHTTLVERQMIDPNYSYSTFLRNVKKILGINKLKSYQPATTDKENNTINRNALNDALELDNKISNSESLQKPPHETQIKPGRIIREGKKPFEIIKDYDE